MAHWVQIELAPNGIDTAYTQMDLELVERVQVKRTMRTVEMVDVVYGKEKLLLDRVAGKNFLTHWEPFIAEKLEGRIDKEATPGNVVVAKDLNGSSRVLRA